MDLTSDQKAFVLSLCEEHLREAAFLYILRRNLLSDESPTPWPRARDAEDRLTAHMDALLIEGDLAADVCKKRAGSTDPGELYVAVRIGCLRDRLDLVGLVLDELPQDNERKVSAVCDALVEEARTHPELVCRILKDHPEWPDIWARVGADAGLEAAWPPPESCRQSSLAHLLRFSGRIREDTGSPTTRSLQHESDNVRSEAALALLRLGRREDLIRHCRSEETAMAALGIGGGQPEVAYLRELAKNGPVTEELLTGLGLLGDISALPILIKSLSDEALSRTASEALVLLTGADLKEEIFVPDPVDTKELFKEELEKLEKGESPYPPGKEPGVTITRISRNPEDWSAWLDERGGEFTPGTRYRNGEPLSPWSLIGNLKSEILPQYLRQFAYEELVVRYRTDFSFDAGRPVSFQEEAIAAYEAWAEGKGNSYKKGDWYFAGRILSSKET